MGEALSTPWAYGSGHVNPEKALSPGLVYDTKTNDYIAFLCSLNYTLDHVKLIVKRPNVNCSNSLSNPGDLNYPSFSVVFGNNSVVVQYKRTLTNVGETEFVYDVALSGPSMVGITVSSTKLVFQQVGERQTYTVDFVSNKDTFDDLVTSDFGSITWSNKRHQVRNPIAFTWTNL